VIRLILSSRVLTRFLLGCRGLLTRTSSDASNRSSRVKRNMSSLGTNHFYAQSLKYASVSFWTCGRSPRSCWWQDHVTGTLDPISFPYVKDYPPTNTTTLSVRPTPTPTTSLRSAKPSWHRAARTTSAVIETRQRLLLFVAGGMTCSEMREAYLLSNQLGKDIFIGA
jgi:hypothetical protein